MKPTSNLLITFLVLLFCLIVLGFSSLRAQDYNKYDSISMPIQEINEIGFILNQRYAIFIEENDSIGHWTFELRKDTLWFNEKQPIALPGNYEKVIYRKRKLGKYFVK